MIREAVEADLEMLVPMAEEFHRAAGLGQFIPIDAESVERSLRALIAMDNGAIFVMDVGRVIGGIGGLVYPCHFNLNYKMMQETFWYIAPEFRGRGAALVGRFEDWARGRAAHTGTMIALDGSEPSKAAAFYKQRGYVPLEYSFIKRL